MTKLKVYIFRPSGKWYTNEDIEIPDNIQDYMIPEYIENIARIRNMTCLFNGPKHDVPYLVHVGD